MKVLFAAPSKGVQGGMTRWTQHIIKFYEQTYSGIDLQLLDLGRCDFVNINMPLYKRIFKSLNDYTKIFKKYIQLINRQHFDIVHIASSASISLLKDYLMVSMAKRHHIKSIVHFHFGRIPELARKNNWEWKLLIKVAKKADGIIVLDKSSYNTLLSIGINNVSIVPNPISPQVLDIINTNDDIKRKPNTLLFTGHVVKTKGIFELIKACQDIPNIKLKVVGLITDDVRNEIKHLIGTPQWIEICGEIQYENVIKEMMTCDIFVLPTYTEGFPNVILEAMAAGCAIITTPVGAIPQMLEEDKNGKYGLLVNVRDTENLKNNIVRLLTDECLKQELRTNAHNRVNERYNINSVWKQLTNIWQNI